MHRRLILMLLLVLPYSLNSQSPDIRILRSVNSPESLPVDNFFRFVSDSHGYIVIVVPLTMGITGLISHDKKLLENAGVTLVSFAVNSGITMALKYTIRRDRPFITYPDITKKSSAATPSFPSGHTSGAFATATSLSLSFPKWYVIAPSFLWAGTVGFSRMELGVHYPSDVLAGAIIGAGSSWICFKINQRLRSSAYHNRSASEK
jgi:membrane-associated phospholipid phosphatase